MEMKPINAYKHLRVLYIILYYKNGKPHTYNLKLTILVLFIGS